MYFLLRRVNLKFDIPQHKRAFLNATALSMRQTKYITLFNFLWICVFFNLSCLVNVKIYSLLSTNICIPECGHEFKV